MKYVKQLGLILGFSALGEVLTRLLPFPIPASVYGMALLFAALAAKWIPKEAVKGAGSFLVSVLPLLFVVPLVSLVTDLDLIAQNLLPIAIVIALPTVITFVVSGLVTQKLLGKEGKEDA